MNKRTLIIGSGQAAITLVRELRKLDASREITLVTADDGDFYSKPNISNAFAAGKQAAELVLTPASRLAGDLRLEMLTRTAVASIDAARREIVTAQGRLGYEQLVLAVGASPIPLRLAGDGAPDVVSINNLADYAGLRARLAGKHRVAIVGAGLIGCELANDLRLGGYAVDLFDTADHPLGRLLPPGSGHYLRDRLVAIGICFHPGVKPDALRRDGEGYVLIDSRGRTQRYDLIISAIGLRPNLALAKTAGIATGLGIITDKLLRTSQPDIYAIGDCIEFDGHFLPYVMPIMHGAKKLAQTLNGNPQTLSYPAMPIVLKTPACPTVVCPPPPVAGHWEEVLAEEGTRALFVEADSGEACGFVLQGSFTRERMALAARMPGLGKPLPQPA